MCIRLIIYTNKSIYDDITLPNIKNDDKTSADGITKKIIAVRLNKKGFDADLVSGYIETIRISKIYRQSVVKSFKILLNKLHFDDNSQVVIFLRLETPKKQYLDYKCGEILNLMAMERREIDYAMSWLSTLGGAFSAMGEQFDRCAKVAGKISIEQFKLAERLNDPGIIARCQLYASLSLIQQEKFHLPRKLIPLIFQYSKLSKDKSLGNMCHGIWAKLKYSIELKRKTKQNELFTPT